MQPLIRRYVALLQSVHVDDAFLTKFVAYLKRRGHAGLLPQIVRRLERAQTSKGASVTVATKEGAEKFAQSIAAALSTLSVGAGEYDLTVDERVVGGYAVRAKGKLIDRTYRTGLVELYQNVTK